MKEVIKYVEAVLPSGGEGRQLAREFSSFYLHSLLPNDPFSKMHGRDRYTELYVQDEDMHVYKIYFDKAVGQLVMISGDNSVYHVFSNDEIKAGDIDDLRVNGLIEPQRIFCGDSKTAPIMKIEGVAPLRVYPADAEIMHGAKPALLVREFNRQQEIVKRQMIA